MQLELDQTRYNRVMRMDTRVLSESNTKYL